MIFPYSFLPSGVGAPCLSWLGICFADILAPPPQVGGGKWCLLYKALPSPTAAARWDQPQKLPWSRYLDPPLFSAYSFLPHSPALDIIMPEVYQDQNHREFCKIRLDFCIYCGEKVVKGCADHFHLWHPDFIWGSHKEVACQISIWRHDHYDQYPPFPSRLVSCPVISIISGLIA